MFVFFLHHTPSFLSHSCFWYVAENFAWCCFCLLTQTPVSLSQLIIITGTRAWQRSQRMRFAAPLRIATQRLSLLFRVLFFRCCHHRTSSTLVFFSLSGETLVCHPSVSSIVILVTLSAPFFTQT